MVMNSVFSLLHCRKHIICIHVISALSLSVLSMAGWLSIEKLSFVVMWCGLLSIVYVAFLVFAKGLKTLMCKLLKGSCVFVNFFKLCCMWSDTSFLYFYHCQTMKIKNIPVDSQTTEKSRFGNLCDLPIALWIWALYFKFSQCKSWSVCSLSSFWEKTKHEVKLSSTFHWWF